MHVKNDETDLIELAKVLWQRRRLAIKITSVLIFFGLLVAFTSKTEYQATCKLLVESQEGASSLGKLGGLADLAGVNLSTFSNANKTLTPNLYPEIVRSTPFLENIINVPIYFEMSDTTVSSYDYFKVIAEPSILSILVANTVGLPGKIRNWLTPTNDSVVGNNGEIRRYSKEDWSLIEDYADRISVSVSLKKGIISIRTEMPDAFAAAELASIVVNQLTEQVTKYRIKREQLRLDFIADRFIEAENKYRIRQERVAIFADRNRNITTSMVQTEYERLQDEMGIAFQVYKELASRLEQAKIKVKEETPVFSVLQPPLVPVYKTKPQRIIILIISIFFGGILSIGVIFASHFFKRSRVRNSS